jgi:hypothetical protein
MAAAEEGKARGRGAAAAKGTVGQRRRCGCCVLLSVDAMRHYCIEAAATEQAMRRRTAAVTSRGSGRGQAARGPLGTDLLRTRQGQNTSKNSTSTRPLCYITDLRWRGAAYFSGRPLFVLRRKLAVARRCAAHQRPGGGHRKGVRNTEGQRTRGGYRRTDMCAYGVHGSELKGCGTGADGGVRWDSAVRSQRA